MHLACVLLNMSMPESLVAATLNAASALGLSKDYGSLSRGKYADMVIINAPRSVALWFTNTRCKIIQSLILKQINFSM